MNTIVEKEEKKTSLEYSQLVEIEGAMCTFDTGRWFCRI